MRQLGRRLSAWFANALPPMPTLGFVAGFLAWWQCVLLVAFRYPMLLDGVPHGAHPGVTARAMALVAVLSLHTADRHLMGLVLGHRMS